MKKILVAALCIVSIFSCKSQQLPVKKIDSYATKIDLDDSVLTALQKTNDVVLVYANLNFAWARSSGYYILANNKGKWIGILYGKSNTAIHGSGLPQTPVSYDTFSVSQKGADSVWNFFQQYEVWKIKGDDGNATKCNMSVNDAPAWRLMILTTKGFTDETFNAPEIYQIHCPDENRKIFIEACKKIKATIDFEMNKKRS